MRPTHVLLSVVASIALFGCATPLPPEVRMSADRPRECTGANCDVGVYVAPDGAVCKIVVDTGLLIVRGRGRPKTIQFDLRSNNFRFTDDGIVFPDAGDEIRCSSGPRRVTCQNRHSVSGGYKYNVKVTGPCYTPPLDPFVMND